LINAGAEQRGHAVAPQTGVRSVVNAAGPYQVAEAVEPGGITVRQMRLGKTVADLLPPETPDARPPVMPDDGGGVEGHRLAAKEELPADVYVVSGGPVGGVEISNLRQLFLPKRHIAAGHVFRQLVVGQDVNRVAGRAVNALRQERIV